MDNNIIMGLTINTNFDSVNRNNTTGNNFYIIEVKNAIKITQHVMELGRFKETKTEAECDKKTQKKKKATSLLKKQNPPNSWHVWGTV